MRHKFCRSCEQMSSCVGVVLSQDSSGTGPASAEHEEDCNKEDALDDGLLARTVGASEARMRARSEPREAAGASAASQGSDLASSEPRTRIRPTSEARTPSKPWIRAGVRIRLGSKARLAAVIRAPELHVQSSRASTSGPVATVVAVVAPVMR